MAARGSTFASKLSLLHQMLQQENVTRQLLKLGSNIGQLQRFPAKRLKLEIKRGGECAFNNINAQSCLCGYKYIGVHILPRLLV